MLLPHCHLVERQDLSLGTETEPGSQSTGQGELEVAKMKTQERPWGREYNADTDGVSVYRHVPFVLSSF